MKKERISELDCMCKIRDETPAFCLKRCLTASGPPQKVSAPLVSVASGHLIGPTLTRHPLPRCVAISNTLHICEVLLWHHLFLEDF